jgi:hypothetical protein
VEKRNDGSVATKTNTGNGETQSVESVDGKTYLVKADGTKSLFSDVSLDSVKSMTPSINLSSLVLACPGYDKSGNTYTFRKTVSGVASTIQFDDGLGMVTGIRTVEEESGAVTDMSINYQVVDGYTFPESISSDVTYIVSGVETIVHIDQRFDDLVINQAAEGE